MFSIRKVCSLIVLWFFFGPVGCDNNSLNNSQDANLDENGFLDESILEDAVSSDDSLLGDDFNSADTLDEVLLEEQSVSDISDTVPSVCPKSVPAHNESCQPWEGTRCNYIDCENYGVATAACLNPQGIWQVSSEACQEHACGDETCQPEELCLVTSGGTQMKECGANPCSGELITCACAYPGCTSSDCQVYGNEVNCIVCKDCP